VRRFIDAGGERRKLSRRFNSGPEHPRAVCGRKKTVAAE
jgi:hypothetical protein